MPFFSATKFVSSAQTQWALTQDTAFQVAATATDAASHTSSGSDTLTGLNIGTAPTGVNPFDGVVNTRTVVVVISVTNAPTAVTIGGINATFTLDPNIAKLYWCLAVVPTGTTASLVATGSGGVVAKGVWSLTNLPQSRPYISSSATASLTTRVGTGGTLLGIGIDTGHAASTLTLTGLTADAASFSDGTNTIRPGHLDFSTGNTAAAVSVAGATTPAISTAAFYPIVQVYDAPVPPIMLESPHDGVGGFDYQVRITGVQGTTGAGTVNPAISSKVVVSWAAIQAEIGGATGTNVNVTGVQANTGSGTITVTRTANISVLGVQANTGSGTVTVTGTANVAITGVQANTGPGTVTVTIGTNVSITGVQANTAAGTVTDTGTANVSITGVQATTGAGTVTPQVSKPILGVQANTGAGTAVAQVGATPLGVQANTGTGTVTAQVSKPILGVQANTAAGTPTADNGTTANIQFRSVSSNNYTTRGGDTIVPLPAGVVDGDILIMTFFIGKSPTASTPTFPAGWTQIDTATNVTDNSAFNGVFYALWKRASSEGSSYTITNTSTNNTEAVISAWSGCVTSGSPIDADSTNSVAGAGSQTATALSITTDVSNAMVLYLGTDWDAGNESPPTGMTEIFDNLLYQSYQLYPTAGATGNITQATNLSIANPWVAWLVALKPASVSGATNVNITGVQGSSGAGTVTTAIDKPILGVQANTAAGSAIAQVGAIITGVQANTASGSITPNVNAIISGVQANTGAGTATARIDKTLTGVQANTAAGTVTDTGTANVSITGVQANTAAGTVTVTRTANVSITGVQANTAAGSTIVNVQALPSGAQATASAGTVTAQVSKPILGVQANTAAGILTTSSSANANILGVQANTAAGSVTETFTANVVITGVQANTGAGSPTVTSGTVVNLPGTQANTAAGTVTFSITSSVPLLGVQANTGAGTATARIDKTILGVQANTAAGIATAQVSKPVLGVQANTAAGILTTTSSANVNLTGVQANTAAGSPTITFSSNVSVLGVQANTGAGTVTVSTASSKDVPIAGVQANTAAGTVTETTGTSVPVTGVQGNTGAGIVSSIIATAIAGAQANTQAGTVTTTSIASLTTILIQGVQGLAGAGDVTVAFSRDIVPIHQIMVQMALYGHSRDTQSLQVANNSIFAMGRANTDQILSSVNTAIHSQYILDN